jgi:hypothetical protein
MSSLDVTRKALGLYRELLVLHKQKLPPAMKALGDMYIRKEFKTHMYKGNCSKAQFDQFLNAWKSYAQTIRAQEAVRGKELTAEQKRLLNDSQREQLNELEKATADLTGSKQ